MTQHTFEVFKWSGTYYNSVYNTSYKAVVDDDDNAYEGGGDASEKISIDGGSFASSNSQPYAIDVSFTATDGAAHVETFYFMQTGGDWYFTPGPGSEFTVGAKLGGYQSHTTGWDYSEVACFGTGTLIETDRGQIAVEDLQPGMAILSPDGPPRPLIRVLSRVIGAGELSACPKLRPIRIRAGALGDGLPRRDLLVSRQHRMVLNSTIAERMCGRRDVLVPAIRLTSLPGISVDHDVAEVTYYHLLFDKHEVVFAEGSQSESYYAGGRSAAMQDKGPHEEMALLFPVVPDPSPGVPLVRPVPPLPQQNRLIKRHLKNAQPLIMR